MFKSVAKLRKAYPIVVLLLTVILLFAFTISFTAGAAPARNVADVGVEELDSGAEEAKFSHRLIVQLQSPSLSEFSATNEMARMANGKINISSAEAQNYIAQLEGEQAAFITNMASTTRHK